MNATNVQHLALLSFLAACTFNGLPSDYYDGDAPTISSLNVIAEAGNLGGGSLTISGSGFGEDADVVSVIFGSQNAKVLSITATTLEVSIPRGPTSGGPVEVVVGTMGGQVRLEGGYSYDVGTIADNEIAYITIDNDWFSCYGGVGSEAHPSCQTGAWAGEAGIGGRAEFLEYVYPRLHAPYTGYRGGFGGSHDVTTGDWAVEVPSQGVNTLDLETSYENQRVDVGEFTLTNPQNAGETFCSDMSALATYTYGGGDLGEEGNTLGGTSVMGGLLIEEGNCGDPWVEEYPVDELRFCGKPEFEVSKRLTYEPEWPLGAYFFTGADADGNDDDTAPAHVTLTAPGAGLIDVDLVLPEYPFFDAVRGSDSGVDWALYYPDDSCPDDNGDGETTLDESVWTWEWTPTAADLTPDGTTILEVNTYVRATVNLLTMGWLGGEGTPLRATVVVPDDHNFDKETGRSSISLPASVMYQFPTVDYDFGPQYDPFGGIMGMNWGDPARSSYGIYVIIVERVTEYRLAADVAGRDGDVILAYSTGDFGFIDWTHPLDKGGCGDCIDNDGDGWTDDLDPDCAVDDPTEEDGSQDGTTTCSDGIDNDNDGLIDAEDDDCESGLDGETNCADGIDNDGDGVTDELDAECGEFGSGFEDGDTSYDGTCLDGIDDDGDGWFDMDDPDCLNAGMDEVGYGTTVCNDGIDNDGHMDVDAHDPTCAIYGPTHDSEVPNQTADCANGLDDEGADGLGDGYIDGNDPDCEVSPFGFELDLFWDPDTNEDVPSCYDGLDNDCDGMPDALDPDCWNTEGIPDGFLNTELDVDCPSG